MTRTKLLTSKEKLLPEYIRALEFLNAHIDDLKASFVEEISTDIWNQGSISMFYEPFSARNLPSGKNWRWNQTKARKQAVLRRNNAVVNFFKLSTRKRNIKDKSTIPGFKMWQFEVKLNGTEPVFVLWCEKGVNIEDDEAEENEENENVSEPLPKQKSMTLQEISMLAELLRIPDDTHVDPLLSWPSTNSFELLLCSSICN